jgi:hypothetical protein
MTADTLRFRYGTRPLLLIGAAVLFAIAAAVFLFFTLSGAPAGPEVGGMVEVSSFRMAPAGLLVCLVGLAGVAMRLAKPRDLEIGAESVRIPGYGGSRNVPMPYAVVTAIKVEPLYIRLDHANGQVSIMAAMLPDQASFDIAAKALTERIGQLKP